ncbi:MAG: hypothetical protein A2735_03405 [Candidatus Yanofskybacteria bacterium RIFCSPHIGHO2_01_FULL_41_21]|uniref:DUF5666 domain-containing protein n=1 Tax=Candidatus Yanofskybacteria bacterium RIFCSPHIGHO2_01_FULL_41_21 TaxID=1802660 RepID=A0A1F8E9S8_9BACT|nr:MAG: hypothetical protein A2735_03405 [Candidatus Yanofskybacteria bacterium RIFCSPHIGHO2_01_FULL_41_21]
MNKKITEIFLIVVVLVGGAVWLWKGDFQSGKKTLVTAPEEIKIDTYSLSGKITSIEKGVGLIVISASIFYEDEEGIKPEQESRSVYVTKDTKFTKMVQNAKKEISVVDASIDDLKIDMNINVYSSKNPVTERRIDADRVEISL